MAGIIRRGSKSPRPKPPARKKKPPARKPPVGQGGGRPYTPPTPAPMTSETDHSTLDVAGMAQGQDTGSETQVTTEGGPGQDDAVFSTGPGGASSLHYHQATTYQQVYADQVAQGSQAEGAQ